MCPLSIQKGPQKLQISSSATKCSWWVEWYWIGWQQTSSTGISSAWHEKQLHSWLEQSLVSGFVQYISPELMHCKSTHKCIPQRHYYSTYRLGLVYKICSVENWASQKFYDRQAWCHGGLIAKSFDDSEPYAVSQFIGRHISLHSSVLVRTMKVLFYHNPKNNKNGCTLRQPRNRPRWAASSLRGRNVKGETVGRYFRL